MRKMTLVMTHQCNFRCSYCPQNHEDVVMSRETALHAVDLLASSLESEQKEIPSVQISFYGGEPLLAEPLIREVVVYAEEKLTSIGVKKVLFEITTNGLLLKEDFIAFAKQHHIYLALSHDGVGQDMSRRDRGGHATKERVDAILKTMLRHNSGTFIMMTLHPDCVETLCDSMRFFHDSGVKNMNLTLANGPRVNWTEEKKEILLNQLEELETLYEQWNQGENEFHFTPFDNKIRNYILERSSDDRMCHFTSDKIMIDCDGRFFPCNHFIGMNDFCIGNLEDGADEPLIHSLDAQRVESDTCKACGYAERCRHNCACANHGHTGNMCAVSRLQCEYEQATIRLADQAAMKLISEENPKFVKRMYKA